MAKFNPVRTLNRRAARSSHSTVKGGRFAQEPFRSWIKACVKDKLAKRRDPRKGIEPSWEDIHETLLEGARAEGIKQEIPGSKSLLNYIAKTHPVEYKELSRGIA